MKGIAWVIEQSKSITESPHREPKRAYGTKDFLYKKQSVILLDR
jgi:hypothetical protein